VCLSVVQSVHGRVGIRCCCQRPYSLFVSGSSCLRRRCACSCFRSSVRGSHPSVLGRSQTRTTPWGPTAPKAWRTAVLSIWRSEATRTFRREAASSRGCRAWLSGPDRQNRGGLAPTGALGLTVAATLQASEPAESAAKQDVLVAFRRFLHHTLADQCMLSACLTLVDGDSACCTEGYLAGDGGMVAAGCCYLWGIGED
jgi:hypothetical protein